MPPQLPPSADERRKSDKKAEQDDMWKLDAPIQRGGPDGKGPLLDSRGKVCLLATLLRARIFIILSSLCGHSLSSPLGLQTVQGYRPKSFKLTTDFQPCQLISTSKLSSKEVILSQAGGR